MTRSFKSARMMLKIHLFWPWHQKHTNLMPFQPCYFNSGTCLHPSQSPSLVEMMSAFLFVNADMILSLKIKCERKIVARRRRTHRQYRGILSCSPQHSHSQDKHACLHVYSLCLLQMRNPYTQLPFTN